MKTKILLFSILIFIFLASCENRETDELIDTGEEETPTPNTQIPEGHFVVNFSTSTFDMQTKAAVTGPDTRVQHIRYVIYKSTGEYVKEKVVLLPAQGTPTWPLAVVRDTLPKGSYKVIFLGNIEKTQFPYATSGSPQNYADILLNYKTTYADARIAIPPVEFSNNTEYYWARVSFSDASPNPSILLQRIIGMLRLHRNFVDTSNAVNKLVQNILTQVGYRNIIKTALTGSLSNHSDGILYTLLRPVLVNRLTGLLTVVIDPLLNQLILDLADPIANALYDQLAQSLITQIELALAANATGNETGLAYLGRILNPWAYGVEGIVTMDNFPKTTDLDLTVKDYYPVGQRFKYGLKTDIGGTINDRYVAIKGLNGNYNVKKIDILAQGLVAGLVIDQIIDSNLLLPGAFMDISDPVSATGAKTNLRYKADYSFVDLRLKSYTQQTDGNHRLTLSVQIGNIANIDGILANVITIVKALPIVGPVLGLLTNTVVNLILGDIKALTVSVPVNLPLLEIDNLTISGSWSTVTSY